jgi:hypothetical protein
MPVAAITRTRFMQDILQVDVGSSYETNPRPWTGQKGYFRNRLSASQRESYVRTLSGTVSLPDLATIPRSARTIASIFPPQLPARLAVR